MDDLGCAVSPVGWSACPAGDRFAGQFGQFRAGVGVERVGESGRLTVELGGAEPVEAGPVGAHAIFDYRGGLVVGTVRGPVLGDRVPDPVPIR